MAENGEPGQQRWLRLELKLLADVGLVGLPNAGKSTLLASVTEARPKIADYPFTTMTPQLGVVSVEMDKSFVLADIPGLIEGAHTGAGLGHDFLKHIERTRLLIHVLDAAPADGHDPLDDFQTIETELASYDQRLASRPRIVALNKTDIVASEDVLNQIKLTLENQGYEVHLISAVTTRGVQELMQRVFTLLEELPVDVIPEVEEVVDRVYTMEPARFSIEKDGSLYKIGRAHV